MKLNDYEKEVERRALKYYDPKVTSAFNSTSDRKFFLYDNEFINLTYMRLLYKILDTADFNPHNLQKLKEMKLVEVSKECMRDWEVAYSCYLLPNLQGRDIDYENKLKQEYQEKYKEYFESLRR